MGFHICVPLAEIKSLYPNIKHGYTDNNYSYHSSWVRARELEARKQNHENFVRIRELAWQSHQRGMRIAEGEMGRYSDPRMFPFARDSYSNSVPLRRFHDDGPLRNTMGGHSSTDVDRVLIGQRSKHYPMGDNIHLSFNSKVSAVETSEVGGCRGLGKHTTEEKLGPTIMLFGVNLVGKSQQIQSKKKFAVDDKVQQLQQQKRGVDINLEFVRVAKRQLVAEEDEMLAMRLGSPMYHRFTIGGKENHVRGA